MIQLLIELKIKENKITIIFMEKVISKVSKNGSAVDVEWSDGEKSNFNFMWLRDNCPTAHDKDSRHRMFNILEISTNIEPKTC